MVSFSRSLRRFNRKRVLCCGVRSVTSFESYTVLVHKQVERAVTSEPRLLQSPPIIRDCVRKIRREGLIVAAWRCTSRRKPARPAEVLNNECAIGNQSTTKKRCTKFDTMRRREPIKTTFSLCFYRVFRTHLLYLVGLQLAARQFA